MRRSRLLTLLGGTAPGRAAAPVARRRPRGRRRPTPVAPTIKLHCALVIPAGHPARERVGCGWSARHGRRRPRLPPVEDRRRRAGPAAPPPRPRHARTSRSASSTPTSGAATRTPTGSWRSAPTGSALASATPSGSASAVPAAKLALNCAYVIDAARQGVACHWAKADRPARGTLRAVRSVDGGAPRADLPHRRPTAAGRSSTRTSRPASRSATRCSPSTADGRVVGVSRADTVLVPTIATP